MTKATVEREVKLQAPPDFVLPDLAVRGLVPTVLPVAQLAASYWDTPSRRLARWGLTARHRVEPGRSGWTVKLPVSKGAADGLVRREVPFAGEADAPPAELCALVAAVTRGEPLRVIATVLTERRAVRLADDAGVVVLEVADDGVVVRDPGAAAVTTFREVEVEVLDGVAPKALRAVVKRLEQAGAVASDPTPKLFRAMHPVEPEVPECSVGSGASVGELVAAAVARHVRQFVLHLPGVVQGEEPEDVHQARVALRRLRSNLRTFERWLEPAALDGLADELRATADALGSVRDADVLAARWRADAAGLDAEDRAAAARLVQRLGRQRRRHRAALVARLSSPETGALVDRLVLLAQEPPLSADASAVARRVARSIVRRPWRRLEGAAHEASGATAEDLTPVHAARVAAKRARYAADAVAPVQADAARLARRLASLQDVLGEVQDAVVAEVWLRSAVAKLPAEEAFAAGRLAAAGEARLQAALAEWPAAWNRARRAAGWLR